MKNHIYYQRAGETIGGILILPVKEKLPAHAELHHIDFLYQAVFTNGIVARCPLGKPGDEILVKEAWNYDPFYMHADDTAHSPGYIYRSSQANPERMLWKSSRCMPIEAVRTRLTNMGVEFKRVQEISEAEAQALGYERPVLFEGIDMPPFGNVSTKAHPFTGNYTDAFKMDVIHRFGLTFWESNSYIWVVKNQKQ